MNKKLGVLIFFVLLLGFGLSYFFISGPHPENSFSLSKIVDSLKMSSVSESSKQKQDHYQDDEDLAKADIKSQSQTQPLETWLRDESKNIEASSVNPDLSEKNYIEKVKKLSLEEIYKIQQIALDSQRPAHEKIFASYMLSLSVETPYLEPLEGFVLKPLIQREEIKPHSQDEIERAQELALKYMQIDRLYEKALARDTVALESLKKIARLSEIEQVRLYAQQKLDLIR